jgi:hypothetical protein
VISPLKKVFIPHIFLTLEKGNDRLMSKEFTDKRGESLNIGDTVTFSRLSSFSAGGIGEIVRISESGTCTIKATDDRKNKEMRTCDTVEKHNPNGEVIPLPVLGPPEEEKAAG